MIYLDNAATSFPKPRQVVEEVTKCLTRYCGNAGRGAHPLSLACAEKIYDCRVVISDFLGVGAPERVLFTHNTTHALNLAIKGLFGAGAHILIWSTTPSVVRLPACSASRASALNASPSWGFPPHKFWMGSRGDCSRTRRG